MKDHIYSIYAERKMTAKFGIIGGVGFVCNYIILSACTSFGLNKVVSELIAAAVALQVTFLLHDKWTYRIDQNVHTYNLSLGKRYRAYVFSNSFATVLTAACFSIFSNFLNYFPALVLGAIVGLAWNFVANKKVIWHHRRLEEHEVVKNAHKKIKTLDSTNA